MPENQAYDNNYRIALFKCKEPKSNPKGPDLSASFEIDNVAYRASLWIVRDKQTGEPKKDRNNFSFYTGPIDLDQPPEQAPQPTSDYPEPPPDTSIPF